MANPESRATIKRGLPCLLLLHLLAAFVFLWKHCQHSRRAASAGCNTGHMDVMFVAQVRDQHTSDLVFPNNRDYLRSRRIASLRHGFVLIGEQHPLARESTNSFN